MMDRFDSASELANVALVGIIASSILVATAASASVSKQCSKVVAGHGYEPPDLH